MRTILVYADKHRLEAADMIKTKKHLVILLLSLQFVLFVALLLML